MSSITVIALLSWTLLPGPSDVLQTEEVFGWAPPSVAGWEYRVVRDGVPLLATGYVPLPGWGSFDTLEVRSPLEAGVWGAGAWELDFSSQEVPDSSFRSGIGLIENTGGANRYSASLRRPILSFMNLDLSMAREDTLGNQRIVTGMGTLETGGRGWQTSEDGYALWAGWNPEWGLLRLTFAHPGPGGRHWEALGMWRTLADPVEISSAASVSLQGDSLYTAQGHVRLETPLAGMRAVARGDLLDEDGEMLIGGGAGLLADPWFLRLQLGVTAVPGGDPGIFGAAGAGPADLFLLYRDGEIGGGLQAAVATGRGFIQMGAAADPDTLRFRGTAMPALRWGSGGMIYGGVTWEVTSADTSTVGTMDVKSMFTLGRFAFIFALEDVLDQWRSYSFGVTWTFSDRRERPEMEDRE